MIFAESRKERPDGTRRVEATLRRIIEPTVRKRGIMKAYVVHGGCILPVES